MGRVLTAKGILPDRLPLLVSALGVLVAVIPVAYLPSSSGALAFVVLVAKGIGVTTGLGVVCVGLDCIRIAPEILDRQRSRGRWSSVWSSSV